ncbi:hypothetical protein L3Q82_021726, partial [Scortum barcoo]
VVMGDIRQSLLPRDVLSAAKELLYHLDIYICNLVQSGRQPPQVDSKTLELVEEFILHAPKDRNTPPRRMTALQELQLLEIMCSCFQEQSRDAVRQLMFSALFSLQGNQADESRMALLGKLVSMAIAVSRVPILECAATWLQRTHRVYCVRLAQVLVDDYCSMVPGSVPTLQNIHSASPRFCCQFITAVTTLYDLTSEELTPPLELLQMIGSWIQDDPRLVLITFLNTPLSGNQPLSSLDVTPLGGLVRWCVKAPLAYRRDKKLALTNGTTESEAEVGPLFSALHLSVLQVFMLLPNILNEKGLFGRLALLQMESLAALTSDLSRLLDQADKHTHSSSGDTHALSQLALDRLAQALQVAMANGALLCSREDLRAICSRLPHNKSRDTRVANLAGEEVTYDNQSRYIWKQHGQGYRLRQTRYRGSSKERRPRVGSRQLKKKNRQSGSCRREESCEAEMDQARSTISKIFNGEPHSYTRFNLTQNMEGDNSQVEMKLSSDMDEEVGVNHNHNSNRKPYVAQKLGWTVKNLCFMVATILLIFIIGYLIGYLVHRKKELASTCSESVLPVEQPVAHETGAAPLMDWDDVKTLLAGKLSETKFETVFSEFSIDNHQAGSPGDEVLANKVLKKFKDCGMNTWTDEHFVKVQDPPATGYNRIVFKGKEEHPVGFLSYSGNGTVTNSVLYAYYGQEEDFMLLQDKNINMSGKVMLVRAGKISFAEKVANAAKMKASAVLIYPDPADYSIGDNTELFGHVHMGSGDPYTPGFPSFNHTQFPPVQSSGLPKILAQTITTGMANSILGQLGGQNAPVVWGGLNKLGNDDDVITVEVNNILTEKKIHNVFGVITGFVDADRYVVIGAQRDAWGPGFATSTVGTSVLVELARSISEMKNSGFKPRRSIVFASWSAGEYGSVGATEWLEGYLTSLSMKAFSYINLDGVVSGRNGFKVAASPLLHRLIDGAMKEVNVPNKGVTLDSQFGKSDWESNVLEPMKMDDTAYPFLAFSGIPSVSFRFVPGNTEYQYFGTKQDTRQTLNAATANQVPQLAVTAAQFAGHIALRLVHDHLLRMDLTKYNDIIRSHVRQINMKVKAVQRLQPQLLPKVLTVKWLISASGSYTRASQALALDIQNSDLEDIEMCRIINDRIMTVEKNLLSPYVSPRESPFRHILLGSGPHTLKGLSNHLEALRTNDPEADAELFRNQFALATWTIQGCANSLAGNVWSLDNEI